MGTIIDGKAAAAEKRAQLKELAAQLKEQGIVAGLAVIIVGNDPASRVYVNNKKKACDEIGIVSYEYALKESTSQEELLELIDTLNTDDNVNGILCQLPLPGHIDEKAVIERIAPEKDVDAFNPVNVGHIMTGDYTFLPCTPAGVMELLHREGVELEGKNCVVIGRSNIVGKPMALMLLKANATVTVCHSKTVRLADIVSGADVIIAAVGKPRFVTADMCKPGAIVVDVGINRGADGKLCGDVDYDTVLPLASKITPVPGGVGPMTIAMLMQNVLFCVNPQKHDAKFV